MAQGCILEGEKGKGSGESKSLFSFHDCMNSLRGVTGFALYTGQCHCIAVAMPNDMACPHNCGFEEEVGQAVFLSTHLISF